jgi:hypothetical protein
MEGLAEVSRSPKLVREIERHEGKLLPCFMEQYERLMALPRRVRKAIQRKWKHSLAGVALLLALGAAPAQAATTINVPAGDEAALIQAINDANSEVPPFDGPDTIVLANSTFTLTEVNNTTYRPTGLPVINSAITIDGNGSTIMRMGVPFHIFAVSNSGNLTLQETTVSGGSSNLGGGVFNGGTLTITNSTISDNSASDDGGGVFNAFGTVTLNRTLISGNAALTGPEIDSNDDVTADNFNLFGYSGDDGVSGFSPGATDIVPAVGLSAILDTALADNGGNTLTHALVSGSPAIDAAGPSCPPPATDQRGVTRPQGAACDIGAFELGSSPPTPTPSPSPTQTPKPTSTATPTPTATPSPEPSNNGSSGCSIAQSLESGSALANLLIPLLPIFAVGMKYLRRRVE